MNPLEHLRTASRQRRLRLPFWLLFAGLALALGAFVVSPSGFLPLVLWLSAVAVSLLGAWLAYTCIRPNESETARRLDAQLNAKNRFEAAAELASQTSPMAVAQRQETQSRYSDLKKAPAVAVAGMLALAILLLSNLGFLIGWAVTTPSFQPVPTMAELPPAAIPEPKAKIEWISPEAESTATSLEVLPLTATATSSSGLENMELIVAVNGQEQERLLIDTDLSEPGSTELEIDVYLDLYELSPYDMVTYFLQGQRVFEKELMPTVSDLQFVQIRPFRSDAERVQSAGGGGGPLEDASNLMRELKLAQLTLFKQNFLLAHADRDNEVWPDENTKVASEQANLVEKTTEAIDFLTAEGASAVIVDLLVQARPFMNQAAESMIAMKNPSALPPQGQALGKLTEIEKHIRKLIIETEGSGSPSAPEAKDPFADSEKYHLPPREETSAGQLEQLAQEQEALVEEFDETDPEEAAEKQEAIARQLESIGQNSGMSPAVKARMQAGADAAKESLEQLTAGDPAAAREPATRVLQNLNEAIQKMRDEARTEVRDLLAEAQRELNDAAREQASSPANEGESSPGESLEGESASANQSKPSEPQVSDGSRPSEQPIPSEYNKGNDTTGENKNLRSAQAVAQAREALRREALRQQQFGSEEFAILLAKLAEQMDGGIIDLETPQDPSAILTSLSDDTAEALLAIEDRREALTMTRDLFERSAGNLKRLSQTKPNAEHPTAVDEAIGDLLTAAQMARLLLRSSTAEDASETLWRDLGAKEGRAEEVDWGHTRPPVESLIAMLNKRISGMTRESIISIDTAGAAPEAYRDAVSAYFERLSTTPTDSE